MLVSNWSNTIAPQPKRYDTASRAYNKAVRDRNYFQQYGTAPAFQHKQVVIRMKMIRQLPLVLNSVSKPRQVITKPCKIIMMPLPIKDQS